jgi:hypothetical protein
MLDWLRKKLLSDSTPPAPRGGNRRTPATEGAEYQLLENRQLMATLLSSSAVSYQDIDGDQVTVNFSGRFLTAGNVNSIFQFDTGSVSGSNAARQQLRSLNLGSVPSQYDGSLSGIVDQFSSDKIVTLQLGKDEDFAGLEKFPGIFELQPPKFKFRVGRDDVAKTLANSSDQTNR